MPNLKKKVLYFSQCTFAISSEESPHIPECLNTETSLAKGVPSSALFTPKEPSSLSLQAESQAPPVYFCLPLQAVKQ